MKSITVLRSSFRSGEKLYDFLKKSAASHLNHGEEYAIVSFGDGSVGWVSPASAGESTSKTIVLKVGSEDVFEHRLMEERLQAKARASAS